MKCPVCKFELYIFDQLRVQTLSEHVCDPNGEPCKKNVWKCSNPKCSTHEYGVIWNDDGELYSDKFFKEGELKFINDNDAPFGSYSRQANVEIYKKGMPKTDIKICKIGKITYLKEYWYKSNEDGDVLKSGWKLKRWKDKNGHTILYQSPLRVYKFHMKHFKYHWTNYKQCGNYFSQNITEEQHAKNIKFFVNQMWNGDFYPKFDNEKRKWFLLGCWVARNVYFWRFNHIKKMKAIIDKEHGNVKGYVKQINKAIKLMEK